MKALTIRQPWASLIAEGVKTIETRSWSTKYRGPIAIHAGKAELWRHGQAFDDWIAYRSDAPGRGWTARMYRRQHSPMVVPLPLGAVVATAVLTDCVPMVGSTDGAPDGWPIDWPLLEVRKNRLLLWPTEEVLPDGMAADLSDQLPFGEFAPGRWAWLLDDIKPTTDRCPFPGHYSDDGSFSPTWETCPLCDDCLEDVAPVSAKGKQGLWNWDPIGGDA